MTEVVQLLQDVFECKLKQLILEADYGFKMAHKSQYQCENDVKRCSDVKYHQALCLKSKQRIVKTVRLRLSQVAHLVPILNLKIIVLHRDPRGVMNSRWGMGWCNGRYNST